MFPESRKPRGKKTNYMHAQSVKSNSFLCLLPAQHIYLLHVMSLLFTCHYTLHAPNLLLIKILGRIQPEFHCFLFNLSLAFLSARRLSVYPTTAVASWAWSQFFVWNMHIYIKYTVVQLLLGTRAAGWCFFQQSSTCVRLWKAWTYPTEPFFLIIIYCACHPTMCSMMIFNVDHS